MTRRQARVLVATMACLAAGFLLAPETAAAAVAGVLAVWFAANAAFRAVLLAAGTTARRPAAVPLAETELPAYTILVPLCREAEILPALVRALRALDYPARRLEIKLIAEADDAGTLDALNAAALDARFEIVVVPEGFPRTKPRACNFALRGARGDLVVIYDAEDRPEPDQLRKAAALFAALPPNAACLQARLNFYNANENLLTRGIMAQTPQSGKYRDLAGYRGIFRLTCPGLGQPPSGRVCVARDPFGALRHAYRFLDWF